MGDNEGAEVGMTDGGKDGKAVGESVVGVDVGF